MLIKGATGDSKSQGIASHDIDSCISEIYIPILASERLEKDIQI